MRIDDEGHEEDSSPEAEVHRARDTSMSNLPRIVARSLACRADQLQHDLTAMSTTAGRHSRVDADILAALQSVLPLLPKYVQPTVTHLLVLFREADRPGQGQERHAGGQS